MLQLKLKNINSAVSLKIYQYIHHGRNHCKNYDKESFKFVKHTLYVMGPGGLAWFVHTYSSKPCCGMWFPTKVHVVSSVVHACVFVCYKINVYMYTWISRIVIGAGMMIVCELGNTGAPSAPKDTTNMKYGTPSVSPVTVIIVLVVFPTLSLVASLVVWWNTS